MFKIFLNKKKSKDSINEENTLNLRLINENRTLPLSNVVKNVNEYEQYLKEKKESQTYRLSFNITPLCSNVLFNKITEIVFHEGGDDCIVFNKEFVEGSVHKNELLKKYCEYKDILINKLYRDVLIRDTGFSHQECGGIVYHCGYDIFNNHMLRKKEFNVVNKLGSFYKNNFNTIYDLKRDSNGNEIENWKEDLEESDSGNTFYEHLYMYDTIHSFEESVNENLIEKNGWVGFINPNGLNVANYGNISLNKCMNANKACEMIDMYPDRSLFSFTPKINKFRDNRIEKNWDYCLTYPFENFYDNDLVQHKCESGVNINGLQASIVDDIFDIDEALGLEFIEVEDGSLITLKTIIKHNFNINSIVNIVLIGEDINGKELIIKLEDNEKVMKTGFEGKNKEYYFSIYADELLERLNDFKTPSQVDIRVRRVNDGGLCEYYFRKFRRIPNFNNSNVYNDDIVSESEIKEYSKKDFNSTLNNLGFSRTIYNDNVAQILFNDDINLKGLKDNLGREISEVYLTIVKNNEGYKEWYQDFDYSNSKITNSRCFGRITSGVEMLDNTNKDYNIHVINNVSPEIINYESGPTWDSLVEYHYQNFFNVKYNENGKSEYYSPKVLEDDINKYGVIENGERTNTFLGDVVEFSKNKLIEYSLTDVLHRFNTVQREMLSEEYRDLMVDEILYDDYDLNSGFTIEQKIYNEINSGEENTRYIKIPFNIDAEGYFYKPHHKIELKKYKDIVKQGAHTRVLYSNFEKIIPIGYQITTSKNYYFEMLDEVYFYHKISKELIIGRVFKVEGKNRNIVSINITLPNETTIDDYFLYRPNSEKPYGAYELLDGSGRYLWREVLEDHEYDIESEIGKYVFTNGAHYINKQIIFSLHRQDPTGEYLISSIVGPTPIINNFGIAGVTNEYSNFETMLDEIEEDGLTC